MIPPPLQINRIRKRFTHLAERGEKALIPFITAGDPTLGQTEKLIFELERNGADIIELGIPFSDPLADGPVIQQSYLRALRNGVSIGQVLDLVKRVRRKCDVPLLFMASYNLIFQYGEARFVRDAERVGLDGVIVPDLPLEESKPLWEILRGSPVDLIFLLAPTSDPERVKAVSLLAGGFVYYISLTGITGERKALAEDLQKGVDELRSVIQVPIAIGFGISGPSQVREAARFADGIVVGSALVRLISSVRNPNRAVKRAGEFVRELKRGTVSRKKGR